jgi:uncharacterized protein
MAEDAAPAPAAKKKSKWTWRGVNRVLHRDLGHVAVGLTFVYALSGIAVNHIADWEPSFESYEETHELGALAGSDEEIATAVASKLGVSEPVRDVYRAAEDDLQVVLDKRTLHIDTRSGHVIDEGQRPRFFLRVANWLHLNRGKKAWTYVADTYAAGLMLLAISGLFMMSGRKGLFGRGGLFLLAGIAVPVLYVELSGGPNQPVERPAIEAPGAR